MKVLILTGFLGAGKTTFLTSLSGRFKKTAILENDYANADVDRSLLKNTGQDVYSLEEGCICCSRQNDFATSVITISNTLNIDTLLIEPTGLGYVSRIIQNLRSISYDRIELLSPIALVDALTMDQTLQDFPDLFIDQICHSGHILLTKTEEMDTSTVESLVRKLQNHTEGIVIGKHYRHFNEKEWQKLFIPLHKDASNGHIKPSPVVKELVYDHVTFPNKERFFTALNALLEGRFGHILRGKGSINVDGEPLKIDIVQNTIGIDKAPSHLSTFVLIGENLDSRALDILLERPHQNTHQQSMVTTE